jgi:hypothetical protein
MKMKPLTYYTDKLEDCIRGIERYKCKPKQKAKMKFIKRVNATESNARALRHDMRIGGASAG